MNVFLLALFITFTMVLGGPSGPNHPEFKGMKVLVDLLKNDVTDVGVCTTTLGGLVKTTTETPLTSDVRSYLLAHAKSYVINVLKVIDANEVKEAMEKFNGDVAPTATTTELLSAAEVGVFCDALVKLGE